jgi:hypothetical protein
MVNEVMHEVKKDLAVLNRDYKLAGFNLSSLNAAMAQVEFVMETMNKDKSRNDFINIVDYNTVISDEFEKNTSEWEETIKRLTREHEDAIISFKKLIRLLKEYYRLEKREKGLAAYD